MLSQTLVGEEAGAVTEEKNPVDRLLYRYGVHPASVGFIIVDEAHEYRTLGTRKRIAFAMLLATVKKRQEQERERKVRPSAWCLAGGVLCVKCVPVFQ